METPIPTETATEPDLDQIIADLNCCGRELPVAAIRAAQQHREAITPRLIEAIQNAASQAREGNPPEGHAHFFALLLLGEFQAKEVWPVVLEAISLPGELPFDLFGDAMGEIVPRVLAVLVGDRLDAMDERIRNRELDEFTRWNIASTYLHLVAAGRLLREDAIARLRQLLRAAIDLSDLDLAGPLISILADLGAREAREEIKEAFRLELVDESIIDLDSAESDLAADEDTIFEQISRQAPGPILDTVAELETWATFGEEELDDDDDEFFDDEFDEDEFADGSDDDLLHESPLLRSWQLLRQQPLDDESAHSPGEVIDRDGTVRHTGPRVGRNDPCPCGSGKKYKKCCGGRK